MRIRLRDRIGAWRQGLLGDWRWSVAIAVGAVLLPLTVGAIVALREQPTLRERVNRSPTLGDVARFPDLPVTLADDPPQPTLGSRLRTWDYAHGGHGHALVTGDLSWPSWLRWSPGSGGLSWPSWLRWRTHRYTLQSTRAAVGIARLDQTTGEVCVYETQRATDGTLFLLPICSLP
jgi:hypothetical protein